VRDEHGLVHKDPNLEVQDRISFVFEAFLRLRTAGQVLRVFNEGGLTLPRRDRFGDVLWKKPTISIATSILKKPPTPEPSSTAGTATRECAVYEPAVRHLKRCRLAILGDHPLKPAFLQKSASDV
jgi:hypothetical protein